MNKICNKCYLMQTVDSFYKNTSAKDGYRNVCKKCFSIQKELYYDQQSIKIKLKKKEYYCNNKSKVNASTNRYVVNRLKKDSLFRLKHNVRSLISKSISNQSIKKNTKTEKYIGCSFEELKKHLESQFESTMTWNNYGSYWSIDHICPCNQAQNEHELIKLQHFRNLRPMITYGPNGNVTKSDNKTEEAQMFCVDILNREWIE